MSIHVLLTGILHKDPVERIAQNGSPYVTCNIRVEQGGETVWANVICFDEPTQAELLRIKAGDALSVQGKAAPKVYMKDDEPKPSLQVTASHVLPLQPRHESKYEAKSESRPYPKPTRTKASSKSPARNTAHTEEDTAAAEGFDDPLDF